MVALNAPSVLETWDARYGPSAPALGALRPRGQPRAVVAAPGAEAHDTNHVGGRDRVPPSTRRTGGDCRVPARIRRPDFLRGPRGPGRPYGVRAYGRGREQGGSRGGPRAQRAELGGRRLGGATRCRSAPTRRTRRTCLPTSGWTRSPASWPKGFSAHMDEFRDIPAPAENPPESSATCLELSPSLVIQSLRAGWLPTPCPSTVSGRGSSPRASTADLGILAQMNAVLARSKSSAPMGR
jgi:hypothetical protein